MANNHTALNFVLVDTTEQQTYVITSFTFVKNLTEHLDTGYNRLLVCAQAKDLNFVANLNTTSLDTACNNSTTTCDREHVLNRHQERFINVTRRKRNPVVNCIHKLHNLCFPLRLTVQCTESRTTDDRSIVAIILVCRKKITHFHLNELEHLLVVNHIALVQEYNQARNVYLTSQKDVLTSLRHRTVSCSNHDDCTVHLSGTSYHVLHIVGVSRAVNVRIVAVCSFILNVRSVDCDTTLFFFRSIVDRIERTQLRKTLLCQNSSNGSGQSSFTVVNVTDSTDVNMRFGPFKFLFSHNFIFCLCLTNSTIFFLFP